VALGVALVGAILLLRSATADTFLKPSRGYSLVVGAPGSGLELVLNAVFHVGTSPGLLEYGVFEELERNPATALAVPYAVGDSFRSFRVVGTTEAFFEPRFPYPSAQASQGKFAQGRSFHFDRAALNAELVALERAAGTAPSTAALRTSTANPADEAVLGASVAAALGIQLGDRIEPTHGVEGAVSHATQQLWEVVGILRPTGTPVDKLVLINLDSFFRISDHGGGIVPETGKPGVSAVVLFPKPGVHKALLLSQLNKRTQLQVADVDAEVHRLLGIVGNVDQVFFAISVLVVVVGVVSVAVAIYNTLSSRGRELGILRILGARRRTLFGMLLGEATLLSALGAALGLGLAHLLVFCTAGVVERSAGFRPSGAVFLPEELAVYVLVVGAGALGGLLPAFKAYRAAAGAQLAPLV
jgi:putative ABC transport system permease protein